MRPLLLAALSFAAALSSAQGKPNQTVLRPSGMLDGETADAYVNGVKVGTLRTRVAIDISRYVKPGTNRLTIKWAGPVRILGANVGYAREPGRFAGVGEVRLNSDPILRRAGSKTITFRIPGAATGDAKPAYGSTARQTVLKVTGWVEPQQIEAFVNGKSVGELSIRATIDITDVVRPGRNTLKIVWTGSSRYIDVKVAYAKSPNVFGDAGRIHLNSEPFMKRTGSKSLTFMIPK